MFVCKLSLLCPEPSLQSRAEPCCARPQVVFLFLPPFTLNHPVVFPFSRNFTSALIAHSVSFSTPLCQRFPSLRLRSLPHLLFSLCTLGNLFLLFHPLIVFLCFVVLVFFTLVYSPCQSTPTYVFSSLSSWPEKKTKAQQLEIHSQAVRVTSFTRILKGWCIGLSRLLLLFVFFTFA